jgi:hypothetical protein
MVRIDLDPEISRLFKSIKDDRGNEPEGYFLFLFYPGGLRAFEAGRLSLEDYIGAIKVIIEAQSEFIKEFKEDEE